MSLPDDEPFAITQGARKRGGLAQPACHRSIADQEGGNLGTCQPTENSTPFQKNRPDARSISSHPAAKIAAGEDKHA